MHKLRHTQSWLSVTAIALAAMFYFLGGANGVGDSKTGLWTAILLLKTAIEVIACVYSLFYIFVALSYRQPDNTAKKLGNFRDSYSDVFVAYLCCDDIDPQALASAVKSSDALGMQIWVHDDSLQETFRRRVDDIVHSLETKYQCRIPVLRRKSRSGGKPGAINNLIRQLPPSTQFLLICDSDSYLPEQDFLANALAYFVDPQVALVQFRNIGYVSQNDAGSYKILSQSIDFYDAFVSFLDRFGWSPFLGHNALLRVSSLKELGGLTPGQLADDIDYSVRLRLRGYKIKYAREIACGERHPKTYEALRRRTCKWAYGCTEVLVQWSWAVATNNALQFGEKVTFFLTVAYYPFQLLLFFYLVIFYFFMPLTVGWEPGFSNLLFPSVLILLLTFLPSITFFMRHRCFRAWPKTAAIWGLTYGSQDFVILTAVTRCLLRRSLGWTPTNILEANNEKSIFIPEVIFGASIICFSANFSPVMVMLPTTALFAGKFLITPALNQAFFADS